MAGGLTKKFRSWLGRNLLLGMRNAEGGRCDEKFPLVAIDGIEIEREDAACAQKADTEVVNVPRFSGKVRQSKDLRAHSKPRLPVYADVALAGVCLEK